MVHDADLEDEKFDRKEAVGIDLMLKGLAHMQTSSDEIWLPESRRSTLFHGLKGRRSALSAHAADKYQGNKDSLPWLITRRASST